MYAKLRKYVPELPTRPTDRPPSPSIFDVMKVIFHFAHSSSLVVVGETLLSLLRLAVAII